MTRWYRGFTFGMEESVLVITSDRGPNVAWALRYGSKCSFRFETPVNEDENYYLIAKKIIDAHWTEKGY